MTVSQTGYYRVRAVSGGMSVEKLDPRDDHNGLDVSRIEAGTAVTQNVCTSYQTVSLVRYKQFELWAYYPNSKKWTGGVSHVLQPAKYGDVETKPIGDSYFR